MKPPTPWRRLRIDPSWSCVLGGDRSAAEAAVAESVAVAREGVDLGVVEEAVDHAAATTSSPKTSLQRPKGLLLVTSSEVLS